MKSLFDPRPMLSVSSSADGRLALRRLLGGSGEVPLEAASLAEAVQWLASLQVAVVICDEALADGGWQDVPDLAMSLETPPPVIVTSRLADGRWMPESCGGSLPPSAQHPAASVLHAA